MTYETGAADDLEDLLTKLDTFATTTHGGWTQGYTPNPQVTDGWFELHKGSLSVSMKYPTDAEGPPVHMSVHHASGYINSSTAPGAHTADSGNGYNTGTTGHTNANLLTERCVRDIGDGPFPSYTFFADDTSPNDYIHCVVEPTSGMFRHFGFGGLVDAAAGTKNFGDNWTGGEYVYGHMMDVATNAPATDPNHQTLLDGLGGTGDRLFAATIRIASGLPNQSPAVWGVSCAVASASLLTDTAGNARRQIHGTFRSGLEARGFGGSRGSFSSGVIPMYSIGAYYRDPNNDRAYLLGYMADVRAVDVTNFEPGQEVTIGSDTWVMFPMSIRTTAAVANRSLFSGIAYRKVT